MGLPYFNAMASLSLPNPVKRFFAARMPQAALHEPVTLTGRRIFILPSRLGLGFAFLLLLMLAGAINYNNSLVFALTFLLAGLALTTMLHTYRNLAGITVRVDRDEPNFAGQPVGFHLTLTSPDRDREAIDLASVDHQISTAVSTATPTPCCLPRATQQRGRQTLGEVTLSTRFPLGLFYCWSQIEFAAEALVYPKPIPAGDPLPDSARRPHQDGDQGRGNDDFQGFRHYHPGDSPRHLNWKALAREQAPLTKTFGGDRVEERWFDWEQLRTPDTELRLSQLCRWVLDADHQQVRYGLRLPNLTLPLDHGPAHRQRCLAALATF